MHELVPQSTNLIASLIPPLHEGEGNFALYVNIVKGIGGFQGLGLSVLWLIGGIYFVKNTRYLPHYIAFTCLTHLVLIKMNIPVFITDLGLVLFLYGTLLWTMNKLQSAKNNT